MPVLSARFAFSVLYIMEVLDWVFEVSVRVKTDLIIMELSDLQGLIVIEATSC